MAFKAYKFRIYPTPEQETVLRKTIGCCRYVYNQALELRREAWVRSKESVSYEQTTKVLTESKKDPETAWLREASSVALQQSLRNLDTAFVNFFRKRARYPKFKKKSNGGSARFVGNSFRLKGGDFYLAKNKLPVKVAWSQELPCEPSQCNVTLNASGQWHVSFLCEYEPTYPPKTNKKVGIDLGIETFATLNDGRKFKMPDSVRKSRKHLAKLQRQHSKKKLGSKNREKARRKFARKHQRVTNIRTDFLHKLSTSIIRENQTVMIEDLEVASMNKGKRKNRNLNRAVGEQGWRQFRTMLEYKSAWYGRELVVIDRFFPSSKTCSCCGKESKFGLGVRNWECSCGAKHDRDVNAAKNILAAGYAVSACGADGSPEEKSSGVPRRSRNPKA